MIALLFYGINVILFALLPACVISVLRFRWGIVAFVFEGKWSRWIKTPHKRHTSPSKRFGARTIAFLQEIYSGSDHMDGCTEKKSQWGPCSCKRTIPETRIGTGTNTSLNGAPFFCVKTSCVCLCISLCFSGLLTSRSSEAGGGPGIKPTTAPHSFILFYYTVEPVSYRKSP